jgi:hypothetical protein
MSDDQDHDNVPAFLRTPRSEPEHDPHPVGTDVVLRNVRPIADHGPAVSAAFAGVVLYDDADITVVVTAPGSEKAVRAGTLGGPRGRSLVDFLWDGSYSTGLWEGDTVVRVHRRGICWSIWRWHDGNEWGRTWYGNLELPWRRTAIGYDTQDWALDVVGEGIPGTDDWSVHFKDEDELQWGADQGVCMAEQADDVREVGDSLMAIMTAGDDLLSEDWDRWVPPTGLEPTQLPDGWDSLG